MQAPLVADAAQARAQRSSEAPAAGSAPKAPPSAPAELRQSSLRPGELIRVPLSVRWRDLDAFNHVNNSKYLSYLEEARLRWMLTIPGMGLDDDVAPVVAASNLNYRRPIGWPGDVMIELFVERLGNTSVTIGHRIVDANEGGVTYCDGNVVMVWIDRTSGRAAPLPASVRTACARR
jgi:YbgC/YbaW family acyl-CoA thioester hydrolase